MIADQKDFDFGFAPEAEVKIVSPFPAENDYNVADAISAATEIYLLVMFNRAAGLCGQSFLSRRNRAAILDAIALAVAKGIIVVEPTGNGSINLDGSDWGDWFNWMSKTLGRLWWAVGRMTAAMSLVPGIRTVLPMVVADLQAWFDSTVTVGGPGVVDLVFPDGDVDQAYTAQFGGSSGASAMVAGISAVVSGVSFSRWEQPIPPLQLRANLAVSGYGSESNTPFVIGPQPDLRQFLWRYSLR